MKLNSSEEEKLRSRGYEAIVGVDEAGRGPLAAHVVAAAVTINKKMRFQRQNLLKLKGLKDSKKLSPKKREEVFELLKKQPAIEWGIGRTGPKVVDRINILQATKLAMTRAVNHLKSKIQMSNAKFHPSKFRNAKLAADKNPKPKDIFLLIDGNFGINLPIPQKSIIKGDEKVFLIKAASIVAKTARDRAMIRYHKKYPQYGFDKHKGYPTKEHIAMLRKHGPCEIHRMSFGPVRENSKFKITNPKQIQDSNI